MWRSLLSEVVIAGGEGGLITIGFSSKFFTSSLGMYYNSVTLRGSLSFGLNHLFFIYE